MNVAGLVTVTPPGGVDHQRLPRLKTGIVAVAAAFGLACSLGSAGADAQREWFVGSGVRDGVLENGQIVETPPQTSGCTSD